jgi:excisionase family DNA binding protein
VSEPVTFTLPPELIEALVDAVTDRVLERLAERETQGKGRQEWLSIASAATHMDVSQERVRKLIARGELPHYQEAPGCRVLLRRAEVDEAMSRWRSREERR